VEHVGKWAAGLAVAALLAGGSAGIWMGKDSGTAAAAGAVAVEAASGVELRDIAGHWAETAIRGAVGKRYVDGYQDGSFLPDRQISRAEFVKMAAAALKLSVAGSTGGDDWYQVYVNAAVGAGVHKWSDFTSGDWNTPMKRSEMARMAVRATGQDTEDDLEWMYLATKAGLIQGVDATGSLDVDGTTTRAQAVTIIERILAVKDGRGEEIAAQADKHAVNRAAVLWRKTNIFEVMPQYFGNLRPLSLNETEMQGFSQEERSKVIDDYNNLLAESKKWKQEDLWKHDGFWNPNDLFLQSGDGLYRAELDAVLAIDLEDPDAPFLEELPPVETLKWYNFKTWASSPYLTKGMPAYLVYYKGRTVFNKDTSIYGPREYAPVSSLGAVIDDYTSLANGNLVGMTNVFKSKSGDFSAVIFPKKMKTDGGLELRLYTPSIPGNKEYRKQLLWAVTPEWIGQ
jgi:hypothetical protein